MTTATAAKGAFEFKEEATQKAHDIIAKGIKEVKIDPATGQSILSADLAADLLALDDLTPDIMKRVSNNRRRVTVALAAAGGEAANEFGKKHKATENVSITLPEVGKNAYEFDWKRERQVMNPQSKETSTKYGNVQVRFDEYATGNHGELTKVKAHVSAAATAGLAD